MAQLLVQQQNMTRDDVLIAVSQFPNDWPVEYLKLTGSQSWWNADMFGEWKDVTIVRCYVPSTHNYFSMKKKTGGHYVVFGYGDTASDRLGLREPFNRIFFWRCFSCSALNVMVAGDRHCAALLQEMKMRGYLIAD